MEEEINKSQNQSWLSSSAVTSPADTFYLAYTMFKHFFKSVETVNILQLLYLQKWEFHMIQLNKCQHFETEFTHTKYSLLTSFEN